MATEFELELRKPMDCSEFKNRTATRRKRWPDAYIWILLSAILFGGCHALTIQKFALEPHDQSALIGSQVIFPCRVENKVGIVQWSKNDFGLGVHRNVSAYERYFMLGNDDEGDFSLEIKPVTLEDEGRYQCQIGSATNAKRAKSRYAHLVVIVPPDPPRILQGSFIDAIENQPVDIECVSEGGKPAADITWVDGKQTLIKNNIVNVVELLPDEKTTKTRSVLRLMPKKKHHNETISCQAQNTADRIHRTATIHIEVKYAPKLNISIKTETKNEMIHEGTEVRIRCLVDANPPVVAYKWYLNSNPVIGDYTEEMIIFNVSRKHNKALVKCEVNNTVGSTEASLTLNVTYPPSFRTRPQNVEAEEETTITLSCDVDGEPRPEIRWLYHEPGRMRVKGKAPNLRVFVDDRSVGRYICKATVEGYPEIESEATIFIKGTPKIISNRTQSGSEGERVTVECKALSIPKPDDMRWFFEGREINAIHDPDYATLYETLPDGIVKSSLVIRASQSKHFGMYNCSVTNEYGNANIVITLKPLKSLPLFIILIAVASGTLVFLGFVILLVMCHRRRRKMNQQMSEKPDVTVTNGDMYKESDRSSNISDLKLHLPQSDSSYELEYTSSDRSDSKNPAGLPLAGPVSLPSIRHDDPMMQFRYSNDYTDPTYADTYFKNHAAYVYDYPQGYAPPPHLKVQSTTHLEVPPACRSLQGSLTRSIDTASTLPLSAGNGSQNNSLQRTNKPDEADAINNLGLPVGGEGSQAHVPVYAQAGPKNNSGVDLRYAATYGNPYLKNSSTGYNNQVNAAKPSCTPAPPPYSAVRSSIVLPGKRTRTTQATHV